MNKRIIYLSVISILLILVMYQCYQNISMLQQKQDIQASLERAEQENSRLTGEAKELEEQYEQLGQSYETLQGETQDILEDIETYQKELQESMDWFKANSVFEDTLMGNRIKNFLEYNCYEKISERCYIKTACFHLINSEYLDVIYRQDIETSSSSDKLQSLSEFMTNGGGDCEDYALFYKAELNFILDECSEVNPEDITIEAYVQDPDAYTKYWLDWDKDWYFETGIKAATLKEAYVYPNVVCGNIYDPNTLEIGGHCIIALTKTKIETDDDLLNELDLAPLVEPQTGEYLGLINGESGIALLTEDNYAESFISSVITDQDYFLFSDEKQKWLSYHLFDERLEEKKKELIGSAK